MYESMDMPDEGAFVAENPDIVEGLRECHSWVLRCHDVRLDAVTALSPPSPLTLAATDPEAHKYALIIARLEAELAAIVEHEKQVAALTAERDGIVRSRREVKAKFDAVDVWLSDFAKVCTTRVGRRRGASTRFCRPE
jgi:hypothetical protein